MAVAGSLVVNVSADASKLEQGFARARQSSKGFAADTMKDLRKMTKEAGRFEKGLAAVTGGGAAGTIAGSLLGGPAMGAALGQLDEMLGVTEAIKSTAGKIGQSIVDGLSGVKQSTIDQFDEMQTKSDAIAKAVANREAASKVEFTLLTQGAEAAERLKLSQEGYTKQQQNAIIAGQKINQQLKEQAAYEEQRVEAAKKYVAQLEQEERIRGQTVRSLEREAQMAGMSRTERGMFNLDPGIMGEERARAQRAFEAMDRRDRAANIQSQLNKPVTDFGGTSAILAGSSGGFSAEQKFKRLAEQQAEKGGNKEDRILRLEEKQLEKAKEVKKELEEINKTLLKNDQLKQAQF